MSVLKRCGLLGLSLLLSLTSSFALFSSNVFAASEFDDTIRLTPTVQVLKREGLVDVSTTYLSGMAEACNPSVYGAYLDAVDSGVAGWTVAQTGNGDGDEWNVTLSWTNNKASNPATFANTDGGATQALRYNAQGYMTLYWNFGFSNPDNDRWECLSGQGAEWFTNYTVANNGDFAISNPNSGYRPLFVNLDITYPPDYDGVIPPDSSNPPGELTIVRPDYQWSVELRSINLTDVSTPPPGVEPYRIKFEVTVGTFDPDDFVELYEIVMDPNGSQRLDLTRLAPARIAAYYINLDGTRKEDTDEFDYTETSVTIYVDGRSFSGTTVDAVCTDTGSCEIVEVPRYEDCSVYNTTIEFWAGGPEIDIWSLETLSCEINNFWLRLLDFLQFIFVPDTQALIRAMNGFLDVLQDKLGFVFTSFEYLIQWITSILIVTPDCVIDTGEGTFFGASVDFDICTFENAASNVWAVGIGFTRLLFAAGLVFLSYNRLFTILKGLGK